MAVTLRDVIQSALDRRIDDAAITQYLAIYNDATAMTDEETAGGAVIVNFAYVPGNVLRYGADPTGAINASPAFQTASLVSCRVIAPHGTYRFETVVTLKSGNHLMGDQYSGVGTTIQAYGCNAFKLPASATGITVEGFYMNSNTALGVPDPLLFTGISCEGISGGTTVYNTFRDVYLQGWRRGIDMSYTWNTVLDNVTCIVCDVGVRLFGQSVNNSIVNSRIGYPGMSACIQTVKDGAVQGEGLMISNTLLSEAAKGILSDGFALINVSSSIIDLIADVACDLTSVTAFLLSTSWVYAANRGIQYRDLGTPLTLHGAISASRVEVTAANAKCVDIGFNNSGIMVTGGTLYCGAAGTSCLVTVSAPCADIQVALCHLANNSTNPSIVVAGSGFFFGQCTGITTVNYLSPTKYVATLTGCATSPTGNLIYSENGDTVTMQIPAISAVSNTAAATLSGSMPTVIRPISNQTVLAVTQDNGVEKISRIVIDTAGLITLHNGTTAVFTPAGTKGVSACTVTYRKT